MRLVKVFLPCFIFLISLTILVTSEHNCSISRCGSEEPIVQFPFNLDQQERCRYPGFEKLSCDASNRTVLELGTSGEFLVRQINYATQEIQLYDQENCLPKRLLTLNLSDSPFRGSYYLNFDFFKCSSDFSPALFQPISCLSSSNQSVYATSSLNQAKYMFSSCELFAAVLVPTEWPVYEGYPVDISGNDLFLMWDTPNCGDCIVAGGKCGFRNSNGNQLVCFDLPRRGPPKAVKYVLTIGVGLPTVLCVLLIACYICGRFKRAGNNRHQHHVRHLESPSFVLPHPNVFVVGLEESVIESYPKTVLGESLRLEKSDDNICPICLSEYQPKETLRTIPDCKHCFHASCIDEWLRRNSSCPICRNTPFPSPLTSPV